MHNSPAEVEKGVGRWEEKHWSFPVKQLLTRYNLCMQLTNWSQDVIRRMGREALRLFAITYKIQHLCATHLLNLRGVIERVERESSVISSYTQHKTFMCNSPPKVKRGLGGWEENHCSHFQLHNSMWGTCEQLTSWSRDGIGRVGREALWSIPVINFHTRYNICAQLTNWGDWEGGKRIIDHNCTLAWDTTFVHNSPPEVERSERLE